jgi:very-short-patch-repair endonuclease
MTKKGIPDFVCFKCKERFLGLDSFHGEYRIRHGGVKNIQLCEKCLRETDALWWDETKTIGRHIQEKIEYHTEQHGIDRHADAKRTAYEEISDLLTNQSTIFNGNNSKVGYGRDLNKLELRARRIVHDKFKINCEEQVQLTVQGRRYVVDGLIMLKGKEVVLEYDSDYYHNTEQQREKDRYKDLMLTNAGYNVVRISEDIIKYEKPSFRSSILDAMYGRRQRNTRISLSTEISLPSSSTI